jgi:hypothetical protein
VSGLSGKRVKADLPGLGEVKRQRLGVQRTMVARSRALASRGTALLRGSVEPAMVCGCPLRPPFNGQLRTDRDRGNPTVQLKQSIAMA